MSQYIVSLIVKLEVLKKVKYLRNINNKKKINKVLQIIYFSLRWTKQLFQKHHSFVEGCLNAKSGYQGRGHTCGDPINCFLRGKAFYIGFKITFLKIINKEIKISFLSKYDYFCQFLKECVHFRFMHSGSSPGNETLTKNFLQSSLWSAKKTLSHVSKEIFLGWGVR